MLGSGALAPSRLADDRRLTAMGYAGLAGGCVIVLIPGLLTGIALLTRGNADLSNGLLGAAIVAVGIIFVLWIGAYVGFRAMFFRDAARVEGAVPRSAIPGVIDTPGVFTGTAEWAIRLPARGSMGRVGKVWIELYPDGIQIWKGPDKPWPRWQFSYRNLLQAESVDVVATTKNGEIHQHFVRVIVDMPRLVFLFGSHWWRNKDAPVLADKLRQHGVPTVTEELDT